MSNYVAYTDGGFDMQTCVGASSVVLLDDEEREILYQHVTARKCEYDPQKKQRMNEQEIGAIIRACMSVPDGSFLKIVSDSQYAVNVLSGKYNAYSNLELIARFKKEVAARRLKVEFEWTRGHNGNKYNELADRMCTDAMNKILAEPIGTIKCFKSDVNRCF